MVRQELAAAVQAYPAIAPLVTPALIRNPASAPQEDVERWAAFAADVLPDPARNNDQTFLWAYRRHGPRALAMLAASLADPNVENPGRYFGRLATSDARNPLDLRFNFRRILALAPPPEPPSPPQRERGPGLDNPLWQALEPHLRQSVDPDVWGSYFDQIGFEGLKGGVLHITTQTGAAAAYLMSNHRRTFIAAAKAAGAEVTQLVATPRKKPLAP